MSYIFWIAAALFAYTHLGYPLLMLIIGRFADRQSAPANADRGIPLPHAAVVLAAFNEEQHIVARIDNLLAQVYPPDRLSIYVGSDGSTDRTAEFLQRFASDRVRIFDFPHRRGKASVLNDLMRHVDAQVSVFTDANVTFEAHAIAVLASALRAPEIGGVCGELVLNGATADNPDSKYWRVERLLKSGEARIGGLLGPNGAIYAIRTECFEELPADTLIDDFVIGMRIASRGRGLIYEPAACASEETPATIDDEFRRRVRIGLGNYQTFFRYPEFLYRTSGVRVFSYFSHKVLRWFGPHLLLVMMVFSGLLVKDPLYATLFALQFGAYTVALLAEVARRRIQLPRWLLAGLLFANVNLAFGVAFLQYCRGEGGGVWTRTARRSPRDQPP